MNDAPKNTGSPESAVRITIREIAERAQVHFTTVGLALRNSPRLSASTRRRIQKLAKEMGYRPDPLMAALSSYRNRERKPGFQSVIAWINNWPRREELLEILDFRNYFLGARDQAEALGYILEEFWLREAGMSSRRIGSILKARNVKGVLMAPQPFPTNKLPFPGENFSVMCFGYSILPARFHVVTNHHYHSIRILVERLAALGYRRAGFIGAWEWDEKVENAWLGGFALARLRKSPLRNVPPLLAQSPSDDAIANWISKKKPDCIIGFSDMLGRLERLGRPPPGDLGFASLNVAHTEKHISGIMQNDFEIGRTAVRLLVSMINNGERGFPAVPSSTLVESFWNEGTTLKKSG